MDWDSLPRLDRNSGLCVSIHSIAEITTSGPCGDEIKLAYVLGVGDADWVTDITCDDRVIAGTYKIKPSLFYTTRRNCKERINLRLASRLPLELITGYREITQDRQSS